MKKIGFILAPESRLSGALEINRSIFKYLKNKIDIQALIPASDDYYQIPVVGTILNYFSLYGEGDNSNYIVGTSFATLPFIFNKKTIQICHGSDTVDHIVNLEAVKDKKDTILHKWLSLFDDVLDKNIEVLNVGTEINRATEAVCFEKAEKIITVSEDSKSDLVKYFELPEAKIKVINNAVPDFWFEKNNVFADNPEIICTSRIDTKVHTFLKKGLDRSFEILSHKILPSKIYAHFGSTNEKQIEKTEEKITKLTGARIYSGLSAEQLKKKYRAGDIFLATSRTESFLLTIIEAMASGLIPVCSPVGIAKSIIVNGENGFLVNDIDEAKKAIELISTDRGLREKMSQSAYKTVVDQFRYEKMLSEYLVELTNIIEKD